MKRIAVITADQRLYRKIALALRGDGECEIMSRGGSTSSYDIIFLDERSGEETSREAFSGEAQDRCVRIVAREMAGEGELGYPFSFAELLAAFTASETGARARLLIEEGDRYVFLDGRKIHLTEVEHKLLLAMHRGGGEYVSRDVLKASVWGEGTEGGVLSVYVHYLREKLEAGGERVIFSSRGGGYKIHERFLGGAN